MVENQITFRVDPRLKARIQELVAEGEFRNVSDCMQWAIRLAFEVEQIPIDGTLSARDPIGDFLESYRGRRLLKQLMREVQAG